jgi:uncharacterized protein (TIGR02246 family)
VLVRFCAPLPANPGMENLFERAFFSRVLEDYRAKRLPIQVAITGKDAKAENVEQLLFDLIKIDKLPGDLIGIEKFGGGKNLAKTLAKGALARGDSPGDSDCWHNFLIAFRCETNETKSAARSPAIRSGVASVLIYNRTRKGKPKMKIVSTGISAIAIASAVFAQTPSPILTQATPDSLAEVRRAIDKGNTQWSEGWLKGDAGLVAAIFAEDGVQLAGSGKIFKGPKQIAEHQKTAIQNADPGVKVTVTTTLVWLDGDTAYETGKYKYEYTEKGKPGKDKAVTSRFGSARKMVLGNWRWIWAYRKSNSRSRHQFYLPLAATTANYFL